MRLQILALACALMAVAPTLVSAVAMSTQSPVQESQMRMVSARGVVCRTDPGPSGTAIQAPVLGQLLRVTETDTIAGEVWYRAERDSYNDLDEPCWIYGPLTTAYDPNEQGTAIIAIADHALSRGLEAEFEDFVAVENLILSHLRISNRSPSPILELRLLEVIDGAAERIHDRTPRDVPLKTSWLLAHQELLGYYEAGGFWYVSREPFWELYDRYEGSPDAETLAWTASLKGNYYHCEGDPDCDLTVTLHGIGQYWTCLPTGD
jgi:hypothetical protein